MTTYLTSPQQATRANTATLAAHHVVFFDPTGRRWRLAQSVALLFITLALVMLAISWQPIFQPPPLGDNGRALAEPDLGDVGQRGPIQYIGAGPLVRVVRLDHTQSGIVAFDPVTNRSLGPVTGDDADAVSGARYAIQRYGYSSVAHRTISLTFDDGHDPTWTPKILDLLSKEKVPATFFVIGSQVAKFPDVVAREAREGHALGNHTMTHPALTADEVQREVAPADRVVRAETGIQTNLFRLPYDGYDNASRAQVDSDTLDVLIAAERLKYLISEDDFDTSDWRYGDAAKRPSQPIPLPPTTMDNMTILLHDGGGNRAYTLAYLQRLIPWARAHGYQFQSLPQVSPEVNAGLSHGAPSPWDRETLLFADAVWVWPNGLMQALFILALVSVVALTAFNILLAVTRKVRRRRRAIPVPDGLTGPSVTVVVAAYNEEQVIGATLKALCLSRYPKLKRILVVDDGSTDRTAEIVAAIAEEDPCIGLLRQPNGGKASALNRGFAVADTEIVVTLDTDTIFTPETIGCLVRRFMLDPAGRLGVVAGAPKVGNWRNLLTRWQALEYIIQIGVDRAAQDCVRAIMVAPGACAAWRRVAVLAVGGHSRSTLAEDCDLALELQKHGYEITQDDEAICYTEAPETVSALARQRFRWMYGNIQAIWKHRRMFCNPCYGWLGMVTLPFAAISVLLPMLFLPFIYLMLLVIAATQGLSAVLFYFALFTVGQVVSALVGVALARERPIHLLVAPLYRLIYEPLRAYVVYRSVLMILRGTKAGWNKLERTGAVSLALLD
ncbi:MAG TPA: bifunctional polysaccharide deacetylase/glycosyltransferase family 2 protein [Ktedonobacterales bacterium]|nr:bifunctional polysaccharide deacetylase/glycosyltransferase family 2 protein [Ktedonobacterales bacterium]